jgi:hypothetical protein
MIAESNAPRAVLSRASCHNRSAPRATTIAASEAEAHTSLCTDQVASWLVEHKKQIMPPGIDAPP